MEFFEIYCTGSAKVIGQAFAKADSGVTQGYIKDEYFCADCAEEDK